MEQESIYQDIIDILDEIIYIIECNDTDVTWSGYDNVDEVIAELNDHKSRLARNDLSGRWRLELIFAPTGPLQEISISSGWDDRFLSLAKRFDDAMRKAPDSNGFLETLKKPIKTSKLFLVFWRYMFKY